MPSTPGGDRADGGAGAGAIDSVCAGTIADEAKGWAGEEARARRAAGDLKRIADVAKSKKDGKLETGSISQVRNPCRTQARSVVFLRLGPASAKWLIVHT